MNGKIIDREKFGHGRGSIVLYEGSPNWKSNYCVNGKEHEESTGHTDKKKAKAWHKAKLDELAAARQGLKTYLAPMDKRVTGDALIDDLVQNLELKGRKSVRKVAYHAKPVREYFGTMRAVDIDARLIAKYVAEKQRAGLKPATINRQTQILGAAFKLALRRGKVAAVPIITKLSEAGNARKGFFEQAEFDKVLAHLPDYLKGPARFAFLTGWRKSEVTMLRWDWIDRQADTLTLPDSKNGRGRVLALVGDVAEIIKAQESARLVETPDGSVRVADLIFHRKGQSLGDFKRAWHSALVQAGFSYREKLLNGKLQTRYSRCFHDFRRTAARNLVRAGIREGVSHERHRPQDPTRL